MPFIGKTPETGAFRLIDSITTSATDTYALTVQGDHYFPASARNLIVSLNGVTQAPETAYTVSGSHIVFASALTASDVIDYILVIGDAVDIGTPSDGTVGDAQLKASLDLSGKTLTFANDQISGNAVDGGTISNFASTGIDDNATSTAITIDSSQKATFSNSVEATIAYRAYDSVAAAYRNVLRYDSGDLRLETGSSGSEGVKIYTGGAERLTLDSSGNLGLSATPDAHYTGYSVFNVGASAVVLGNETTSDTNVTMTINNAYLNTGASAWVYKNSDEATRYTQISGQHRWDTAASGTAGGTITWDEAMRIDVSGNLLVGKTSDDITVIGAQVQADGALLGTRANGQPMTLNRTGSDGDIAQFRKNGTTVGSIGAASNGLYIGSDDAGIFFNDHGGGDLDAIFPYDVGTNTFYNGHVDIGGSSNKFRNIHISGSLSTGDGVTFGSTSGSVTSKTLDDYEEGTWTPVLSGTTGAPSINYGHRSGYYIKVGNTVIARWGMQLSTKSGGSGTAEITGLPFSGKYYGAYQQPACFSNSQGLANDADGPVLFFVNDNNSKMTGRLMTNADTALPLSDFQANSWCIGTIIYDVT